MVRGIRVASLLLVAACTAGVSAGPHAPVPPEPSPGTEGPKVTITFPTFATSTTVVTPMVTLKGLAEGQGSLVQSVRWSNSRGGSGTASYEPGARAWTTAVTNLREVVNDGFTGTTSVRLDSLTAAPTESEWDQAVNTIASTVGFIRRLEGYVAINKSSDSGAAPLIINTVEPFPGATQVGYDVSVTLPQVSSSSDDGAALVFGYQDPSNYCAVFWYGAGAATDLYLLKRLNGTLTTLGQPANIDPAAGDTVSIEVRGPSLNVKVNGVSEIAAFDSECDNADGVGLGVGALRDIATDDASSAWQFDDFVVRAAEPAEGTIELQLGANVITVTATDAAGGVGTDTITITLGIPGDTSAPSVAFTEPTSAASYSTSSSTVNVAVSSSDESGVTSCTYTCSTCAPASGALVAVGAPVLWSVPALGLSTGVNTIVATCVDGAKNPGQATLAVTRTTVGDSGGTAPTLSVPADFTSPTNPARIDGTASDNVAVATVRWTCDRCPSGIAVVSPGPSVAWSAMVTLSHGVNVVTFIVEDNAGNRNSASVAVTYYAKLTITTTVLGSAKQGIAYGPGGAGVSLSAAGAAGPFIWDNNAGGTSLGGGACQGLSISSAGLVSGTPTTPGSCAFTARVRAGIETDTRSFSIQVRDPRFPEPHDYFDDLITRGDCFRAYSFRPDAAKAEPIATLVGVPDCAHSRYSGQLKNHKLVTYDVANDMDAQRQDAARARVPAWVDNGITLASDIDAATQTITFIGTVSSDNQRSYKIDNEVFTQVSKVGQVVTVKRGQLGSVAASHQAGTRILMGANSMGSMRVSTQTDGRISARYLYTWDYYPTDSYVGTGLQNMKTFQIAATKGGQQFVETQLRHVGPPSCCPNPAWNVNTDVAAMTARFYGQSTTPGFDDEPGRPLEAPPFIIKPGTWTRFWMLIEANAETDLSRFVDVTTLVAPIADPNATTIEVDHSVIFASNPFTSLTHVGPQTASDGTVLPGRALRVGSEIMTIVSGTTTGTTRTLTVVRGAQGTTPTTHLQGAKVQVVDDYVTVYVADENNEPVLLYDRVSLFIPLNASRPPNRGGLSEFWIEFNTSTQQMPLGRADGRDGVLGTADDFEDLVAYVRNLVILKNPPPDWSSLRVKPVR